MNEINGTGGETHSRGGLHRLFLMGAWDRQLGLLRSPRACGRRRLEAVKGRQPDRHLSFATVAPGVVGDELTFRVGSIKWAKI